MIFAFHLFLILLFTTTAAKSTDYSDLSATDIDTERFPGKGKRNVEQALTFDDAVCVQLPRLFAGKEIELNIIAFCVFQLANVFNSKFGNNTTEVAALAKVFEEDKLVAKSIQIDAAVARIYTFALQVIFCFVLILIEVL